MFLFNKCHKVCHVIEFELGKLSIFIDETNVVHMKGPVSNIKDIEIKL